MYNLGKKETAIAKTPLACSKIAKNTDSILETFPATAVADLVPTYTIGTATATAVTKVETYIIDMVWPYKIKIAKCLIPTILIQELEEKKKKSLLYVLKWKKQNLAKRMLSSNI